jgi:uncharacterized membrane protein YgdD (TMEM256/DUF423 family)
MKLARAAILAASVAGAAAIVLGAFGAHALRASLDAHALATWHTAVEYQFWHALALLATGMLARDGATTPLRIAAIAFAVGMVLFSGSLYLLALGVGALGAVTPLGGVALIGGWIALASHAMRLR